MDLDPPNSGPGPASVSSQAPLYGSQATSQTKAAGKPLLRFVEEQRASWPKTWYSKSEKSEVKNEKTEKSEKTGAPPGVYWAEDNEINESQYTFYREGTPTPPDYEADNERGLQYGTAMEMIGEPSQRIPPSFNPPPSHAIGTRVCGIRKGLFWMLATFIALIIIGVGVGAGVGLGVVRNSNRSNSQVRYVLSPVHSKFGRSN